MAVVFCPQCSDLVQREGHQCSRCGTDLFASYTRDDASRRPDPAPRLHFAPGAEFAGRFTIIENIGAGGMGTVYKAIDTMLDAEVALKLIQPALAQLPGFAERFRREVRVTRSLTHPNICRYHDIGESDGILYLSMQWIEGETLSQLLEQTGMLREGRALQIAEKIALALRSAHQEGIIHRDLKPANVMIDRRGAVFVLDFGLALERGGDDLTDAGILMGTPAYMAPEQRRLHPLDARADLYALGLILREMLIGMRLDPEPGLPPAVRAAVNPLTLPVLEDLLAEDPRERCPSAEQAVLRIRETLGKPEISTAVTTAGAGPSRRSRRRPWILGAGAVAAVVAVAAAFLLRPDGHEMNPEAAVMYQRGLHYLLEESGTVRGIDDAIQLLRRALESEPDSPRILASLGEAYWTRYRETRTEAARDEARRLVDRAYAIDPNLPEVLNARAVGFIEEGKYRSALSDLERAVKRDPDSASAWVNLGEVHAAMGEYKAAREALRQARKLEPSSFAIHLRLGLFHDRFSEYDEASRYYRRATELKPDSPMAWTNLGASLLYTNRCQEAIAPLERALSIEERASTRANLATALYCLQRYPDAEQHYRRAIELEPLHAVHWGNLGDALLAQERTSEALDCFRRAAALARERALRDTLNPEAQMELGLYCAKAGDATCALDAGDAAVELQPENATIVFVNAVIRCRLDRDDECLDWLQRAIRLGVSRAQIEAAPELERLADDPRFRKLIDLAS